MRSLIVLLLFPVLLTSCAHGLYLGKLAWGEAKILGGSVPLQEILDDEEASEEIKEGIRLVQEVKEFAHQRLGLQLDGAYETFYPVKGDTLIYLVSACPKDSLKPYTWRFPIVGEVEYKGFFGKRDALREIKKLEERGMDTCLQQVLAFSTLGWLEDPIYSTVLDRHPAVIITVIIHELVHNTVFFKGETEFNERIASFIAEKGALLFIEERWGNASPHYQFIVNLARDEEQIAGVLEALYDELQDLYARDISEVEKLRTREVIFAHGQRRLAELDRQLKVTTIADQLLGLNNAVILAHRRYLPSTKGLLQQACEAAGGDIRRVVELLKTARKSKEEPTRFLERWLRERPTPSPG